MFSSAARALRGRDAAAVLEPILLVGVIFAGLLAGAVSAHSSKLGTVALAAMIALALVAQRPVTLAVIAVMGTFAVQRLGGSSASAGSRGGISYSDALICGAAIFALPALTGTDELRRLRLAGRGVAIYLALLLPSLIANPSMRADLEWLHRMVLAGGGLLVGAWIARENVVRQALQWLTVAALLVAVPTCLGTLSHGLHATIPYGFQKNFVGGLLALVLLLVVITGGELGWHLSIRVPVILLLASGVIASHSRGGMLAAGAGLLIAFFHDRRGRDRSQIAVGLLVATVFAVFAVTSVRDQLNKNDADLRNSSIGVRFNVERVTRDVWRTSPLVGVGLKYFNTGKYGYFAQAANNDIDNELAESGVVGLAGFAVMEGGLVVALWRRKEPLGIAALGVVAGQLLHGMVDIYWSAGTVALPFLIAGVALGRDPTLSETGQRPAPGLLAHG